MSARQRAEKGNGGTREDVPPFFCQQRSEGRRREALPMSERGPNGRRAFALASSRADWEEGPEKFLDHLVRCKRAATSGRRKMPPQKTEGSGRRREPSDPSLVIGCVIGHAANFGTAQTKIGELAGA